MKEGRKEGGGKVGKEREEMKKKGEREREGGSPTTLLCQSSPFVSFNVISPLTVTLFFSFHTNKNLACL